MGTPHIQARGTTHCRMIGFGYCWLSKDTPTKTVLYFSIELPNEG